jgi:hypothetical protein
VATFVLTPDGAGYRSKNSWNLVASDDEWAAPTMAEVGPDGNVWIIDWYNYIVQHNPTPIGFETGKGRAYETLLRDKTHGRVYRLVYKEAEPEARVSLAGASAEQLVATLKNTNMFWRLQAQRLLAERGKADVTPALVKLVEDKSVDEIDLNAGAIHALWTLKGLQAFDGDRGNSAVVEAVRDALEHWSPGVQRNAVMVAPASIERAVGDLLKIDDLDRQSRLAALLKLAEWPASTDNGISIFFTN